MILGKSCRRTRQNHHLSFAPGNISSEWMEPPGVHRSSGKSPFAESPAERRRKTAKTKQGASIRAVTSPGQLCCGKEHSKLFAQTCPGFLRAQGNTIQHHTAVTVQHNLPFLYSIHHFQLPAISPQSQQRL